jgi:tetratricopeptide (TPR) repeat protein
MTALTPEPGAIDFEELPEMIHALLQQGVAAYRHDPSRADKLFRQALAADPSQLPVYFCLYKIHTYQGNLTEAQAAAESGLREAAAQAGWDPDWRTWGAENPLPGEGAGRFALYTLKALAFIHLKQRNPHLAREMLGTLSRLDPAGGCGWPVVAALLSGTG